MWDTILFLVLVQQKLKKYIHKLAAAKCMTRFWFMYFNSNVICQIF